MSHNVKHANVVTLGTVTTCTDVGLTLDDKG